MNKGKEFVFRYKGDIEICFDRYFISVNAYWIVKVDSGFSYDTKVWDLFEYGDIKSIVGVDENASPTKY